MSKFMFGIRMMNFLSSGFLFFSYKIGESEGGNRGVEDNPAGDRLVC